jgi:hypothetical protein
MRTLSYALAATALAITSAGCQEAGAGATYVVVDTGQTGCYDNAQQIAPPAEGQPFFGQDAQYAGPQPRYEDNGDGTVTDLNTGLMWQRDPGPKVTWEDAVTGAAGFRLAGYADWRLPTIKELYSLIDFSGSIVPRPDGWKPYIDTRFFVFTYGDPARGERPIDSQYCSGTEYVGTTMNGNPTVFGVNFADGRIKGYPKVRPGPGGGRPMTFYRLYVRGNPAYGKNVFVDNGDGTIADRATGLMWQQSDDGVARNWQEALAYAEGLTLAGHDDWRLPNAKELQSIVDYTRSPRTSNSAAIDPLFHCSPITGEDGRPDFGCYWTSTTHVDGPTPGEKACYVAFGQANGCMWGQWLDVHGAGAQRSDPKSGDPSLFPYGRGPQGDAIRIYNYVRCVRGGLSVPPATDANASAPAPSR